MRRFVTIALLLLTAVQARAAFNATGDLQALVDGADVIVVGTVGQVVGRRVADTAETVSTVAIESVIKGTPSPAISVMTQGGATPTVVAFVEDEPEFATGTRTVLFLTGPDGSGNFRVVAGPAGKMDVVNGLVPSHHDASLADLLAEIDVLCGPSCP